MGYRQMTVEVLRNIYRRWKAGQNLSEIERNEKVTRKTIRSYTQQFEQVEYKSFSDDELNLFLLSLIDNKNQKNSIFEATLVPHLDEIVRLIKDTKEPVKPKTAWLIVKSKYDLNGSYESFKLFARNHKISSTDQSLTIRIETDPGAEIQIDYGKVGTLYDPGEERNRTVWCFAGKLSHSRHLFVEFVFTQNQESFVSSHVRMFEFFGGVPEYLTIDNLKSGVIKPDYYDPQVNRAYQQMAEYYNTFINPCLPASPKQKGKVERSIPVARELFRRLKNIYPGHTITQLNEKAKEWSLDEYGMTKHGTTGVEPIMLYREEEQKVLKTLPVTQFKIPHWKEVTVHSDQFFIFQKNYYSMPSEYRKKKLNVCRISTLLYVYDGFKPIRQYLITKDRKQYMTSDFPEGLNKIVEGTYADWLVKKAESMGPYSGQLLRYVLEPEAALNARRARGILDILEKYSKMDFFQDACRKAVEKKIKMPRRLKELLEFEKDQMSFTFVQTCSARQKEMIRDTNYYLK